MDKKKRLFFILLGCIQAVTAIGAIPAGIGYLSDTSGAAMGVTPELLRNSPLDSFLLPGLFLLLVNGLATATASVLSFMRNRHAGIAGLVLGILLTLWIIIQVSWIGLSSFLQPVFFFVGIAEAVLGYYLRRS